MSRFHAVPYEDQSEINLSPMLDVIFIMLIFFIITASFISEKGLPVALPAGLTPPPDDVESINVIVEAGSTFVINGRAMSKASVYPYVRALQIVFLGKGSRVGDAVVAIDAGRRIGVDVVPIMRVE